MHEADAARALWNKLLEGVGDGVRDFSAMWRSHMHPHGPNIVDMLERRGKRYGTVLEIGTAHGVGAMMLAHFADKVITIDVERKEPLARIMAAADSTLTDRIEVHIVDGNDGKIALVEKLDFDMAFIDGCHIATEFRIDFDLCKRCGLLLCHDYPTWRSGWDGPGAILDAQTEGVLDPSPPFVWWTKNA